MLKQLVNDFSSLIYPNLCIGCGRGLVTGENYICYHCLVGMPRTYFHLVKGNPLEQIFWGRVPIEKATSWFFYRKGSDYQHFLHHLKYKGLREIGVEMGRNFGAELVATNYFGDVDLMVPVPLHPKKEKQRGYNQSVAIAEGLSQHLNVPIDNGVLIRQHYSETQTKKGRFERWENVSDLFGLTHDEYFAGKHVLLVDDVVTTGSTLEACARKILECNGAKVSVVTLGFASI
ncbi:MAG TPA: ComF family protein [Prolixibacteraceae bacterium]|nr:ComF family protein [Prolixibacteraceae bacterium]HPS13318.1 ComF family protein [Prolixibacteraceae bacterium]